MKAKLNTRLLRKVQKHIEEEPLRLDMGNFVKTCSWNAACTPPCGTTGCIAGWALVLTNPKDKDKLATMDMAKVAAKAAKLLGLKYTKPTKDAKGYYHWWIVRDENGNVSPAVELFQVDHWPAQFAERYRELQYQDRDSSDRKAHVKRQKQLAKIVSERIDYYIKHRK